MILSRVELQRNYWQLLFCFGGVSCYLHSIKIFTDDDSSAPRSSQAFFSLWGEVLNTVTFIAKALANLTAMWPNPPKPHQAKVGALHIHSKVAHGAVHWCLHTAVVVLHLVANSQASSTQIWSSQPNPSQHNMCSSRSVLLHTPGRFSSMIHLPHKSEVNPTCAADHQCTHILRHQLPHKSKDSEPNPTFSRSVLHPDSQASMWTQPNMQ
jgi:hypothetical protein